MSQEPHSLMESQDAMRERGPSFEAKGWGACEGAENRLHVSDVRRYGHPLTEHTYYTLRLAQPKYRGRRPGPC